MQNQVKLIGMPAGVASVFPHPDSSVYHLLASGLRVGIGQQGDITGNYNRGTGTGTGTGHGASVVYQVLDQVYSRGKLKGQSKRKVISRRAGVKGRARGKLARPCGVGLDPAQARDLELLEWLQPSLVIDYESPEGILSGVRVLDLDKARARAAIVAAISSERDLPSRILAAGRRAAARQASRIWQLRNVRASRTSLEDAASDAVLGILAHVRRLDKLTDAQWQSVKVLRVLGLYAGRAAFRSLASWSVSGMSGDASAFARSRGIVQELTEGLAQESSLLAASLPGDDAGQGVTSRAQLSEGLTVRRKADDPLFDAAGFAARRALVRWVYQVGLRDFKASLPAGKGTGQAVKAARSRCRVVGNVILGQSLIDSCALSGFGNVKAFVQSCKASGFFESLRQARAAAVADCAAVELARVAQRRFALQAASAIKRLRALDVASWDCERLGVRGAGVSGSAGGLVAVRRLIDARGYCVAMARHYKGVAARAAADNLRAFERVLQGLASDRFGDLSALVGLQDKQGRKRGACKVDASMIGRARGKLSRKPALPSTVPLAVGRSSGALPCAAVVSGAVTMDGPCGFILIRQAAAR